MLRKSEELRAKSEQILHSSLRIHPGLIVTGDWFVDSREKMREITEAAAAKDFVVLWTVAAEPEVVDSLRAKYDFVYDVYFADELEIKTIVRSNPGLIWLDNGLVKDKWSVYDFSKALKAF